MSCSARWIRRDQAFGPSAASQSAASAAGQGRSCPDLYQPALSLTHVGGIHKPVKV